jgi:pterin-4a-carbinolamine dehydratase
VEIVLSTHDAGGLSLRDVTLARAIDALVTPA